ncbi:MAG TPA: GNAT family N-acetyltransferase [Gaiellaceae bacterium]|nr:GNAT family N-acetyltransferase [Gaiellaceae bacterium]
MSVDRIRAFRRAVELAAAERHAPTPHGVGLFADSVPSVYDANYVSIEDAGVAPDELAAETDRAMERYHHRRVILEHGDDATAAGLAAHGYLASTHLVMAHAREPDRRVDTSMVQEVEFDRLAPSRSAITLAEPWGDEEIARQLNDAKRLIARAVPTRFFAAIVGGEVAAYCELRSDGATAQIEDVEAVHAYRGRGLGRAIVQHALDAARCQHDVVFLEALADDWPRLLYAKLGFDVVDRRDFLTKFPHPLTRLRLRTPRLELRIATAAELRKLFDVAERGIHDPGVMPFGVAWTDNLDEESFVAHHTGKLAAFRGEDWAVAFVAFDESGPVGVQELRGERFAEHRIVDTGSWLGASWQGRGLGTEMRTAVLAFAFDGLGAERATSGAIQGNLASLGVSRKLGYEVVGAHSVSPRGVSVDHADLELSRDRFIAPVPVEISGIGGLPPLFGASP